MTSVTGVDDRHLAIVRRAYRLACLTAGLDPSERELNLRMQIISGILDALRAGELDAATLAGHGTLMIDRGGRPVC